MTPSAPNFALYRYVLYYPTSRLKKSCLFPHAESLATTSNRDTPDEFDPGKNKESKVDAHTFVYQLERDGLSSEGMLLLALTQASSKPPAIRTVQITSAQSTNREVAFSTIKYAT